MTPTASPAIYMSRSKWMETWTPVYLAPEPISRRPLRLGHYPLRVNNHPLNQFTRMMHELGLTDPTGAIALLDEARSTVTRSRQAARDIDASGSGITGADPLDTATKQVLAQASGEKIRGQLVHNAQSDAAKLCQQAVEKLEAAGDALITDLLAPEVDKIIASGDTSFAAQERYEALYDLAAVLRGWAFPTAGSSGLNYKFARPDEVHSWRLNNSRKIKAIHYGGTPTHARIYFSATEGAPTITLREVREYADEWKPGLYTAAQVHEHAVKWATL